MNLVHEENKEYNLSLTETIVTVTDEEEGERDRVSLMKKTREIFLR